MSYLGSILIIIYSLIFNQVNNNIKPYKETDKNNVGDTIKWSPTYRLTSEDFKGTYSTPFMSDPSKNYDTAGHASLNILYELKVVDRKLKINAYAVFLKNKSFLKSAWGEVLKHEQAHFDIAEIYALRFAKIVNETDCKLSADCFFNLVDSSYKKIMAELERQQNDFDLSFIGELSRRQYYNWIQQELKGLMEGK